MIFHLIGMPTQQNSMEAGPVDSQNGETISEPIRA
jgi:hypothetical protein